jgi:hypothetical protein
MHAARREAALDWDGRTGMQCSAVRRGAMQCSEGLDWDWTGLDWTGLDWTDWTRLAGTGLGGTGMDWHWTGQDAALDWTAHSAVRCSVVRCSSVQCKRTGLDRTG